MKILNEMKQEFHTTVEDSIITLEKQLSNTKEYQEISSNIYECMEYITDNKIKIKLENNIYDALRAFGENAYKMGMSHGTSPLL